MSGKKLKSIVSCSGKDHQNYRSGSVLCESPVWTLELCLAPFHVKLFFLCCSRTYSEPLKQMPSPVLDIHIQIQ